MTYQDVTGREYARLSELKQGDQVRVDGDFDCMEPWSIKEVRQDHVGPPYIECSKGIHSLDGQLMDDNDHLVGIYKEPAK